MLLFARKSVLPFSRRGFVLFELVITLAVFMTALFLVLPFFGSWQREKRLEAAAEEIASALRAVSMQAKSESELYPNEAQGLVFYCTVAPGGRTRYGTRKGRRDVLPRGYLPEDIILTAGTATVKFRKSGPVGGSEYRIELKTKDEKYRRIVTVAAYTGRVRVEKR